jgi:hypothetical protein
MISLVGAEPQEAGLIDVAALAQVPVQKPKAGTVWRMNFARSDVSRSKEKDRRGEWVETSEYSAWAPTGGSFHMPLLFGRVKFVE